MKSDAVEGDQAPFCARTALGKTIEGGIGLTFPYSGSAYTLSLRFRLLGWNGLIWTAGKWALQAVHQVRSGSWMLSCGGPSGPRPISLDQIYTATLTNDPGEGPHLFQDGFADAEALALRHRSQGPLEWPLRLGADLYKGYVTTWETDFFDVRLWSRRLSDGEIAADFQRFDPDHPDLVARVDFTGGEARIQRGINQTADPTVFVGSLVTFVGSEPEPKPDPEPDLREFAKVLAPVVHLHPKDPYRPSSVPWFLERCEALRGETKVQIMALRQYGWPPTKLRKDPWAWPQDLSIVSAGDSWNSPENNAVGLSPIPKHRPEFRILPGSVYDEQQIEALNGEPIYGAPVGSGGADADTSGFAVQKTCMATCYCHITKQEEAKPDGVKRAVVTFTYYFFYPYNGGMGDSTWYSEPLGFQCGHYAHIGDWERVSIRTELAAEGTIRRLEAIYEHHGDENVVPFPGEEPMRLEELKPLTVYSCWHSHASWPTAGKHPTDTKLATDYAEDGGPTWYTGQFMEFINRRSAGWVAYNGLFGANARVNDDIVPDLPVQKNGPEGPAYKSSWTKYGAEWFPPG